VCQRCGGQVSADMALADGLLAAAGTEHGFRADLAYMALPGLCARLPRMKILRSAKCVAVI
jgi:hypothetical protein